MMLISKLLKPSHSSLHLQNLKVINWESKLTMFFSHLKIFSEKADRLLVLKIAFEKGLTCLQHFPGLALLEDQEEGVCIHT